MAPADQSHWIIAVTLWTFWMARESIAPRRSLRAENISLSIFGTIFWTNFGTSFVISENFRTFVLFTIFTYYYVLLLLLHMILYVSDIYGFDIILQILIASWQLVRHRHNTKVMMTSNRILVMTSGNLHVCMCMYVKPAVCMMYVYAQKNRDIHIHTFQHICILFVLYVCM